MLLVEDLSLQYCPSMEGVDNGDMWRTAWSPDGRYLYAGGEFERAGKHPVRRWDDGGRGAPRDVAAASAKGVTYLAPRAAGGVYFAGSEPALGAIDENHHKLFEWRSPAADFRAMDSDFRLSADGAQVYFKFAPDGGETARLSLRWAGGAAESRPDLYLLAAGVSDYAAEELRLNFAHKDARDFAAMLGHQDGRAYAAVHLRILSGDEASAAALRDGLAWLRREARAGDFAALFLAGHGVDDASGAYFFLPHDGDPARLAETALAYGEIKQALTSLSARSLLFVDTCRAGGVWGRPGEPSTDVVRVVNDLSSPEALSCSPPRPTPSSRWKTRRGRTMPLPRPCWKAWPGAPICSATAR